MKIIKYCTMAAVVSAMLALAGCGNNSAEQSNSTNSASGIPPSPNEAGTNVPAPTNPPAN